MDRLLGQTLGDYRVLEPIGHGSMSRVYRAVQVSLRRPVALKVFQDDLLSSGDHVARMRREAESLAQIQHPNVVPVYGAGSAGDLHYLALKLVEGGTLADLVRSNAPRRRRFLVVRDAARGLAALHARGGVHRDLKPTNILVEEGVGLLADFGLARLAEDVTITGAGAMVGTPAYMSPEQWRRERATPASDVFSLGVVLYEALAGRHPFLVPGADARRELPARYAEGAVPPEVSDLPAGLAEVVARCLSVDPSKRPADAQELVRALEAVSWPPDAREVDAPSSAERTVLAASEETPRATEATAAPVVEGRFGRYVLRGELGKGGMGVVYRAWDPSLSREVALKVLRGGEMASDESVVRFEREARAAARLRHPGIVAVHDVGVEDGRHYFTMDLVEGRSLKEVLNGSGLPIEEAVRLVVQAARAVEHAHRNGVIHRDLKPANVFIEGSRALVGDFGLAREVSAVDGATVTGQVMGTPAYMSPEQAAGEVLDARTDVYSLGAILYETLAGRPPFQGEAAFDVVRRVLSEEPPAPRRVNPRSPRDPEVICLKAMEKDARRRYPSAGELADDLERWLRREPILARPASAWYRMTRRVARNPAASAAMAVVLGLLLAIGGVWLHRRVELDRELVVLRPQADDAYAAGDLERAQSVYSRILAIAPDDAQARERSESCRSRIASIEKLRLGLRGNDFMREVEVWSTIIGINPVRGEYHRERAICRIGLQRFEEARQDLLRALELQPADPDAHIYLTLIYEEVDRDHARAMAQLAEAARLNPDNWVVWLERSYHHLEAEEWTEAAEALGRVLEAKPRYPLALNNRACAFERLGRFEEAIADYDAAIEADRRFAKAHVGRALALRRLGRLDEAQREADLAVEMDPSSWGARHARGLVLEERGLRPEAEEEYSKSIQLEKRQPAPFADRARVRVALGKDQEAVADCEAALRVDPRCAEALAYRALLKLKAGDHASAEEDFRASLDREPNNVAALVNFSSLLGGTGRVEEGIELLDRAVRAEPSSPIPLVNRAGLHRRLKHADLAEADYREAIGLDAGCGEAHFGLGQVLDGSGRAEEAEASFGSAIESGYERAWYSRGVCRLLRKDYEGALEDLEKTVELDDDAGRRAQAGEYVTEIRRALEGRKDR